MAFILALLLQLFSYSAIEIFTTTYCIITSHWPSFDNRNSDSKKPTVSHLPCEHEITSVDIINFNLAITGPVKTTCSSISLN